MGIMLSEISQAERDKYCMISLILESKKQNKRTNRINQKLNQAYREQTADCQK